MALGWYVWRNLHDLVGTTPLELSAPRHFQRKARGLSLSVSLDNVRAADTEAVQTVHGSAPLPRRLQQVCVRSVGRRANRTVVGFLARGKQKTGP